VDKNKKSSCVAGVAMLLPFNKAVFSDDLHKQSHISTPSTQIRSIFLLRELHRQAHSSGRTQQSKRLRAGSFFR
jgi:hypothetical protein